MIHSTVHSEDFSASERLQVGIGVVHGLGGEKPLARAADELAAGAICAVNVEQLLARGAVLLATGDWCRASPGLPRAIRDALQAKLGYPVPLIGGSMAKMFCLADPDPVIDPGLLLIVLFSNDLHITVGKLEKPYQDPPEQRRERLRAMADDMEGRAGIRLGSGAERCLFGILPGIISNDRGRRTYCDNELHQEILAAFDFHYRLIGAAAADALHPTTGYQFADDECLESGIAVALIESELSTGSMIGHGFRERRDVRISVDGLADGSGCGYEVSLLDGKPASQRLAELHAAGLLWFGRPVFGIPNGPDSDIVLVLSDEEGEGERVRLTRKVSLGDRLYLLDATPEQMMECGRSLVRGAQEDAHATVNDLAVILAFACTGRFAHCEQQGQEWREVIRQVYREYPGVPIVAALGTGEFGMDRWHRSRPNSLSLSMWCLTTKPARRTLTRKLERPLLTCANRLMLCQTPREIMQTTLQGAVEAGATGGQVCLVDYSIGRIVGGELGCSLQSPGSPHDWAAVAKLTDRPASEPVGGEFPSDLRAWARAVKLDVPLKLVPRLSREEDILTLVVRTLQAVFVTDTHDPRFACDVVAADVGNVRAHLAIPMVGSQGSSLATLQVSFEDGTVVDRESLDAWVSYAQKAAVALERAQESEERQAREAIAAVADEMTQNPVSTEASPTAWCARYLDAVMRTLGADGCHIRLLAPTAHRDEYRLASAVGFLADLRFRTRPITHEGDGSCNRELLLRGGVITNTKEEARRLNQGVKALQGNDDAAAEAFRQKLAEIEATAMLPLVHQEKLLGSFVIDSRRRYFFTERRRRLAESAARLAAGILAGKSDSFDRAWLANEQRWVLETLGEAPQASAGNRLRWFVKRLCDALNADVASVFVWHDTPKRFILHTAHNWAVPMEGKAEYALGEGWTGGLASSSFDVSIAYPGSEEAARGTKKYYAAAIPPEHQGMGYGKEAHIGLRLGTGMRPVAVIVFEYYPHNADRLVAENARMAATLRAFGPLLTLAVEAVKQEVVQRRTQEMAEAKDTVAAQLMMAVQPDGTWQPVVDAIREKFCVERASLYPLFENRFSGGICSVACGAACVPKSLEAMDVIGVLRDVVYRKRTVHIAGEENRYLLEGWPSPCGIRTLLALPVVCTEGQVRGLLELVNRTPTPDHPYEAFASDERRTAEEVARALGTADMSRAKQLEAREMQSRLETATRIGAASLAGGFVMHRLMTPFALIQGSVDWLRLHPTGPPDDRRGHLDRIQASCSEAVSMIQRASQRGTFERRPEKLRTLVKQALRAVQPETSASAVRLDIVNDLAVPVYVEPYSIVAALINLLANALDAMGAHGDLSVVTELTSDQRHALIRIRNTGATVTPEQIKEFFRAGHTTKDQELHLGLGLAIARQAIEDAGGMLEMVPATGGGVEARVLLPLVALPGNQTAAAEGEN